jgi:pyruvate formate lyase activating enzyme
VIVKGINDDPCEVARLYEVADAHDCVKKVELLKFRKLCAPKYENLGIEFPFGNIEATTEADIKKILDTLNKG